MVVSPIINQSTRSYNISNESTAGELLSGLLMADG